MPVKNAVSGSDAVRKTAGERDKMNEISLPLTIERQLERYVNTERHSARHETLWHTWKQNRRWIVQLLEGTIASFPTYSRHDASHAETVLHNIEMILGEDRIKELSATDCFVLLHTVYIHDIGMTITASERKEIVTNDKFMRMVDYLEEEGDASFRRAVNALKRTDYSDEEPDDFERRKKLYMAKLEIYGAIVNLIANYRRGEHGEKSRDKLYKWTLDNDKLGGGFSLAGMPQRIFLTIAECAQLHTEPDFEKIYDLAQEDDGYVFDYMHPRFVSLLLQLGDILDLDNDRFHPLAMLSMDDIPEMSRFHYKKHLSIRRLHIRPDKIEISADCDTQEALRLVRRECDMLVNILKQAGYAWPKICPAGFPGALPTVSNVNLKLNGKNIPKELVTTKFQIPQKKAFEILEGSNIYQNRFAFLREFLQNALDATKLQYWKEYQSSRAAYLQGDAARRLLPHELEKYISTDMFPIEITMRIAKRNSLNEVSYFSEEDYFDLKEGKKTDFVWGVQVRIKDFGTGISSEDLQRIACVGTSIDKMQDKIRNMPEWLKPTAEFGVGLQSAFLVSNTFKCYTYTRTEEKYEMTFGSGALNQYEGYINVKPAEELGENLDTYGSCFEVFVPETKKMLHEQFPASWDGSDIFSCDYNELRPLRHAAELMSQMTVYVDGLIGETSLFPIHLTIWMPEKIKGMFYIDKRWKIKNVVMKEKEEPVAKRK